MNKQNMVKTVAIVSITLAIFYLIFMKIDFYSVMYVLSHANVSYLFLAILLLVVIIFLTVKRWQVVLGAMDYSVTFTRCFFVVMGAYPLTSITPSKSGDVIRAYYLKDQIPITKTVGGVLTERVFDIFALVLFSLIGMFFLHRFEFAGAALIVLIAITAIFFISYFHSDVPANGYWKNQFYNLMLSMKTLIRNINAFSMVMLYSFLIWFLSMIQILIFFYAINVNVPLLFTMANIPIAIAIGFLPITLGGMGTRDAAIILLFSDYASSYELLGVGILFSIFRYWLPSFMGIPFMKQMMK